MAHKKLTKWTVEEERVLTDQVTRNANNLTEAFRKTSRLTSRTKAACVYHWYRVMSKKDTTTCFVTIGKKTINKNRKIVTANTSDNTERVTVSWWKKLLTLLHLDK